MPSMTQSGATPNGGRDRGRVSAVPSPPRALPGFGHFTAADAQARRLPLKFGGLEENGVLYILEYGDGMIKVGRSAQPQKRVEHLVLQVARLAGVSFVRGWMSPAHSNYIDNEAALIGRGQYWATTVRGNEYLLGVKFETLVKFAGTLVYDAPLQGPESLWRGGMFGPTPSIAPDGPPDDCWHRPAERGVGRDFPLPAPTVEGDYDALIPALKQAAEAAEIPEEQVLDWSWFDAYKQLLDSKLKAYEAQLRTDLERVRARILSEGRVDLFDPMVPDEVVAERAACHLHLARLGDREAGAR